MLRLHLAMSPGATRLELRSVERQNNEANVNLSSQKQNQNEDERKKVSKTTTDSLEKAISYVPNLLFVDKYLKYFETIVNEKKK